MTKKSMERGLAVLRQAVKAEIGLIEADGRYKAKAADVTINAPLALIQVGMKARRDALQWVLSRLDGEASEPVERHRLPPRRGRRATMMVLCAGLNKRSPICKECPHSVLHYPYDLLTRPGESTRRDCREDELCGPRKLRVRCIED